MISKAIRLGIGALLFVRLVVYPVSARMLVFVSQTLPLEPPAQISILRFALQYDECNTRILDLAGDAFFKAQNAIGAAMSWGNGIACSPGHPMMRFKYGEAMLAMGYKEGMAPLEDAARLDPNNPIIAREIERVSRALQQQLQ